MITGDFIKLWLAKKVYLECGFKHKHTDNNNSRKTDITIENFKKLALNHKKQFNT